MEIEIKTKARDLNLQNKRFKLSELKHIISWLDFKYLKVHFESSNANTPKKTQYVYKHKLFHLEYDNFEEFLDSDKMFLIFIFF